MISDEIIELINRDLDGTLTEKEKVELYKEIESSSEAKEMIAKLRLLHKNLGEIPEVEPPVELKENVMRELKSVRRLAVKRDISFKSKIVDLLTLPRFQMGGMFAMGAAAVLLLLVVTQKIGDSQHAPAERAIGTIISPEIAEDAVTIESKNLTIDGHKVSITTSRLEKTVIASIDIASENKEILQIEAIAGETENFRFSAVEYTAPDIIYASFNNELFSAALAGPGKLLLGFEDPDGKAETLEIELKTELSTVREVFLIQRRVSKNS